MHIVGNNIILRAVEEDDLHMFNQWANNPDTQKMLGSWHFPISRVDQKKWFDSLCVNSNDQRFAIDANDIGLIGTANLVSIDWKNGTATHGMQLGDKKSRGKGFAQDTVMSIMRYAFDELNLERLDSDIIEYNLPSLNLYLKKCGWIQEGVRKGWYYRNGKRWDKIIVGITRDQYVQWNSDIGFWK